MDALGNGGLWGWSLGPGKRQGRRRPKGKGPNSSDSSAEAGRIRFPVKQAVTAASLALTGDTIAQLSGRWRNRNSSKENAIDADDISTNDNEDITRLLLDHDWLRALRMTSYGFLLYGPGSYAWYRFLDHSMPKQNVRNLMLKVLLNQIALGPSVITVIFAWNSLWQGKLSKLPGMYKKDALPTLLYGFRFWIPVSILNFWIIPLQARVAFMSMGSIFWNFCLSSTMSKLFHLVNGCVLL